MAWNPECFTLIARQGRTIGCVVRANLVNPMQCHIDDLICESVVTVDGASTVAQTVREMAEQETGSVVVMQDNRVFGLFTERDLVVRVVGAGLDVRSLPVGEVCTRELIAIDGKATCQEAIKLMHANGCRRLLVNEDDQMKGMVKLPDVANALAKAAPAKNLAVNLVAGLTLMVALGLIGLLLYQLPEMISLADAL